MTVRVDRLLVVAVAAGFSLLAGAALLAQDGPRRTPVAQQVKLELLGEALFSDPNLSQNRSQACATCHSPDRAFTDPRIAPGTTGAVSLGDDGRSLGDRNAPTAAYARFSPTFHITPEGKAIGGQFLDGRAATLEDQAGGPPLNPLEMAMPDKASVVARLKATKRYVEDFEALFGAGVLNDAESGFAAMTKAIAAFERTEAFAPFSSKYDRFLRGEAKLTEAEELGRVLFFSNQFTNCSQCHRLKAAGGALGETFTDYSYHNIGTPPNPAVRAANGLGADHVDRGLLENPQVKDPAQAGKFKVPTLRNVAVTAPYMHNGVFEDLKTVIQFYNKYNSRNPKSQINPETGQPWGAPEVADTLSMKELELGSALKDERINALVAFLKTLTDQRYEPLLEPAP